MCLKFSYLREVSSREGRALWGPVVSREESDVMRIRDKSKRIFASIKLPTIFSFLWLLSLSVSCARDFPRSWVCVCARTLGNSGALYSDSRNIFRRRALSRRRKNVKLRAKEFASRNKLRKPDSNFRLTWTSYFREISIVVLSSILRARYFKNFSTREPISIDCDFILLINYCIRWEEIYLKVRQQKSKKKKKWI